MKWKIFPKKSDDLIEQILINRGIRTRFQKEKFFNSKISDFIKDLNIPGITKAQKRITEAIKNDELIIVYGDYDVDGVCSSAILYKALTSLGAKVLPYIPHRETEGYGISKTGLDFVKKSGGKLVITVDNGIVAHEQAEYAKLIGLDLIITDHHLPQINLPEAYAIVHSLKMCGAGVAWCLIKDLVDKDLSQDLLQFVCLATICDLMPLVEINRGFVVEGLKILNRTKNLGLLSLINESGLKLGSIGSYEIGYVIGPRINAAGRLESAIDSLRLLCTKDPVKARKIAQLLCQINTERQKLTADAVDQARLLVKKEKSIHVLYSKDWHAGVVGLIAGRITEETNRPTLAISVGETIAKGSARSIKGVNIVEVIREFSDILIGFGGHPGAAGFSLLPEHVEIFQKKVSEYILEIPDEGEQVLEIDAEVNINQLNKKLIEDLQKFEPYGYKNPRPIFAVKNIAVSDIKTVGEGKHLKFKVENIDAIAFNMGNLSSNLQNSPKINLAFAPEINSFNGSKKIQLKVKDILFRVT